MQVYIPLWPLSRARIFEAKSAILELSLAHGSKVRDPRVLLCLPRRANNELGPYRKWLTLRRIQRRLGFCSLSLTTSLSLPFEHDRVSALPRQFMMSNPTAESNAPVLNSGAESSATSDDPQMQVDLPEPADDLSVSAPVNSQQASDSGSTPTHDEQKTSEDAEPPRPRPRPRVRRVSPRSMSEIKSSYELVSVVYGAVHGESACIYRLSSLPFPSLMNHVSRSPLFAPTLDPSRTPAPPYVC